MAKRRKGSAGAGPDDLQVVIEVWKDLYQESMKYFRDVTQRNAPSERFLEKFERDYQKALKLLMELREETQGDFTIHDINKILPDNTWVIWQNECLISMAFRSRHSQRTSGVKHANARLLAFDKSRKKKK